MLTKSIKIAALGSIILFASCKDEPKQDQLMTDNILLQEWEGPYQGVPAFDKMNGTSTKRN